MIQTYCRFLAEAAHLKAEGRISDAILYHVIALELLLNEKNSSTSSVTKRSAALTFTVLGKPYREVLEISERIYDARSKYVHEGRTPDPKLLDEVEMISREIAFVLFRLRQTDANNDEGFRDQWARRLDVLVAHLGADDPVSPSDLHRVGAADVGDFCFADLYRGLSGPVKPE